MEYYFHINIGAAYDCCRMMLKERIAYVEAEFMLSYRNPGKLDDIFWMMLGHFSTIWNPYKQVQGVQK